MGLKRSLALKPNRILLLSLKLTVSFVLLYIVLARTGPGVVYSTLKGMSPFAFISAITLYIFAQFISTLRWGLLLPEKVSIRKLFSLYLIGSFFNTFLPGLIGGGGVLGFFFFSGIGKE